MMLKPNGAILARSEALADMIAVFKQSGGVIERVKDAPAKGVKKPRRRKEIA